MKRIVSGSASGWTAEASLGHLVLRLNREEEGKSSEDKARGGASRLNNLQLCGYKRVTAEKGLYLFSVNQHD